MEFYNEGAQIAESTPKVAPAKEEMEISTIQESSMLSKTKNNASYTTASIYHAEWPPSIFKSAPVMKLLASLSKNTAAPLYSFGYDNRPNIFSFGHCSLRSGKSTNSASTIAVTIYPGLIVLTRMPYLPHSEARLRASWTTPALDAL